MTHNELLAENLRTNLDMLRATLADFSDADMLVRPTPGANHAAWQIGHLIKSEANVINAIRPESVSLPADFFAKFTKETAKNDDPAAFPKKDELLELFARVRAPLVEWVLGMTEEEGTRPSPERMRSYAPTLAHIPLMTPLHVVMHIGQFQVIRRKLGKPLMF